MKEEQRSAELSTRAEALEKKQHLEQTKLRIQQEELRIKQEEEKLAIATEIAISKAKKRILAQFEFNGSMDDFKDEEHSVRAGVSFGDKKIVHERFPQQPAATAGVYFDEQEPVEGVDRFIELKSGIYFDVHQSLQTRLEDPKLYQYDQKVSARSKTLPNLDVIAASFLPSQQDHAMKPRIACSSSCSSGNSNTRDCAMETAMLSVVRHLRKPHSEIFKFSGDPLTYNRFIRQFKTRVVPNTEDDDERLNFLEQFTSGEAYKIVSSYAFLNAKVGYPSALRELAERYGDSETVATAFIQKALKWPSIKPNDSKSLDEYALFLSECEHAVSSIDSIKILEYPENMKRLLQPYFMHDRWRSIIQRFNNYFTQVIFNDLVTFIKRESKKANHPIHGRNAMPEKCCRDIQEVVWVWIKANPEIVLQE